MRDSLANISHSVWELQKEVAKAPNNLELRRNLLKSFHESRLWVEQRRHIPAPDRSFLYLRDGESRCCLLVHGAGGSPEEMKALGKYLFDCGFTVYGLGLPLGTRTQDLYDLGSVKDKLRLRRDRERNKRYREESSWSACLSETEVTVRVLLSYNPRVNIVGLSFGGTIAVHVIKKYPLASAVLIAPALFPVRTTRYAVFQVMRKVAPSVARDVAPREYTILEFMERTRNSMEPIGLPVLVIQSSHDPIVSTKGFHLIKRYLTNTKSRLVLIESDRHAIVMGEDSAKVFRLCGDFIRRI